MLYFCKKICLTKKGISGIPPTTKVVGFLPEHIMIWYYITLILLGAAITVVSIFIKKNVRKAIEEKFWERERALEKLESLIIILVLVSIASCWLPIVTLTWKQDKRIEAIEHKADSLQKMLDASELVIHENKN